MLALQAGAAHNTEADAFFLESSDSDSALETSSAHLLLSDEGAKQSVSQTPAADPVSTTQAPRAASEQAQFQHPKRQFAANCQPDIDVPFKKPRHSSRVVAPGGAADQHLEQKQPPFVHQQAADSPQRLPQTLQNGRLRSFAKYSKHAAFEIAGMPPRESGLGGDDLTQNDLRQQQGRRKASPALDQVCKLLFVEDRFLIEPYHAICLSITACICFMYECAHEFSLCNT